MRPYGDDETVRLKPGSLRPPRRRLLPMAAAGAALAIVLTAAGAWMMLHQAPAPPTAPAPAVAVRPVIPAPAFVVRAATEQEILANHAVDLDLFRFTPNPAVLVLDFASLRRQGLMLNRVAALVEKAGEPHDRVLSDDELDQAIRAHGDTVETYYYGHDYSAADLARFFALADRDRARLSAEEETLRSLLRQERFLEPGANQALISLPRAGAASDIDENLRRVILRHELSHGEFFTKPEYAAYVRRFWNETMDETARSAFRRFLDAGEYDLSLSDLVVNETQAYLMHTRDRRLFSPAALALPEPVVLRLQAEFLRHMPSGWLRDSTAAPGFTPVAISPATTSSAPARAPQRRRRGSRRGRVFGPPRSRRQDHPLLISIPS
jgi:hypothetical protein